MQRPLLTELRQIPTLGGDVFHGMKATDPGFAGFGEAYFSSVRPAYVKGWKLHELMTLNFVVPCGEIQVAVHDERSQDTEMFLLGPRSRATYQRLTIPPGYWVAFGGVGEDLNLLLNIASLPHDPNESRSLPLETFHWSWLGST